ncbi:MAG TPA: phage holin family protein [Candidatus Acidoferrum sp.]|nr:phage holin family protein [Candidatus Acidoferrum sp.]
MHRIRPHEPAAPEGVIALLVRLARLELELGLAEARDLLVSAVIAVAVALVAAIVLIASIVVLIAGAVAPLFGVPWLHLVVAGGGLALISLAAIAWSAWRLRKLDWPKQTLTSFEENWRWLAAQLRSRLTLR